MSDVVKQAPRFTARQAAKFAKELFGFEGKLETLPSERDQNFKLSVPGGRCYVLKIANATESLEVLDLQNQAMAHIARNWRRDGHEASVCPEVQLSLDNEAISRIVGVDDVQHFIRLVSYLPGRPLALVRPHSEGLLADLGRFFGSVDRALADFEHPAAGRDFHWDLQRAEAVVGEHIELIADRRHRDLVRRFLVRFQEATLPRLSGLPQQVIHNDGNDYNVLVATDGTWSLRISGVIDFGDMVRTVTVSEPAIVCAYAMLGKKAPLAAAESVIAAYHRCAHLTAEELSSLFDLICMRLCTSVSLSALQCRLEPDNEYLRISEKPAWHLLEQLAEVHPRLALYGFRRACGLDPVPQAAKITGWLSREAAAALSPVGIDLSPSNAVVLDLSVGSPLICAGEDGSDAEVMEQRVRATMAAAGAAVGIGRYNEARLMYSAPQFGIGAAERCERRTIHLGMDFYLAAGSRVVAPLSGTVHSFQINDDHLDYGPTVILEHRIDDDCVFFTLYGHLSPDSLSDLFTGKDIQRGDRIGSIGAARANGGWPPHLHFQIITDLLDESGNFTGVAPPSGRGLWCSICPDPGVLLGIDAGPSPAGEKTRTEILAFRSRHLGHNLSVSYRQPLKIVRGRGQYLYDDEGRKFLDGVNNVCHVGHCHPQVVAAGQSQMAVLNTNTRYLHDNIVDFAQRLLSKFHPPLDVCYFVCSGSEANELALRMARCYTGRRDIIMVDGAYHGNTQALIDISPYKHAGPGGSGAPDWAHAVAMPDGYRGPYKGNGRRTGQRYADLIADCIRKIQAADREPAAFICESLLGCGGQIVLPQGYLEEGFAHVRSAGGVCIVDEVQVGFGRVGSHFWAFETQGVMPDIVTLGKPIGNGHPLAAVVTTAEIAASFDNGMEYFNTFGGNPVSCAIGSAVLEVVEAEGLMQNALLAGGRLIEGLTALKPKYPLIGDVRGIGLYIGVELVTDRHSLHPAPGHADYIVNRLRDQGILVSTDGPLHNVLKLKPPIVFSMDDADRVVDALDRVLGDDVLKVS